MCDQCRGQGCPNCWPKEEECPHCDGSGKEYYIIDPDTNEAYDCTYEEYKKASDEYRGYDSCPHCDGTGVIEEDDYDSDK